MIQTSDLKAIVEKINFQDEEIKMNRRYNQRLENRIVTLQLENKTWKEQLKLLIKQNESIKTKIDRMSRVMVKEHSHTAGHKHQHKHNPDSREDDVLHQGDKSKSSQKSFQRSNPKIEKNIQKNEPIPEAKQQLQSSPIRIKNQKVITQQHQMQKNIINPISTAKVDINSKLTTPQNKQFKESQKKPNNYLTEYKQQITSMQQKREKIAQSLSTNEIERTKQMQKAMLAPLKIGFILNFNDKWFKEHYTFNKKTNIIQRVTDQHQWVQIVSKEPFAQNRCQYFSVKIIHSQYGSILIGVTDQNGTQQFSGIQGISTIAYAIGSGRIIDRGDWKQGKIKIQEGSTIKIVLDIPNKKLHWNYNDHSIGSAILSDGLLKKKIYPKIQMKDNGDKVQIL